ncbi:MFS general substrate transporter [Aspergillus germanicus]
MLDLLRETPLGQAIRLVSRNKLLLYPEEKADFQLPPQYLAQLQQLEKPDGHGRAPKPENIIPDAAEPEDTDGPASSLRGEDVDVESLRGVVTRPERDLTLNRIKSISITPQKTSDGIILVDWYTTDDPENPKNCAGPTYSIAGEQIEHYFGVSAVAASLGLGLYVLAYGIGDLLFAPLSEIPVIGRNPVYWAPFIIFWVLFFPEVVIDDFGFFGSPSLANGGPTAGDLFSLSDFPFGLSWWVFSAWAGPSIGPVIGGFAAEAKGWRWPMWEIVWMASLALVSLLLFMPETSTPNILLRRARRLRKLTGDMRLQSQSEIDQRHMQVSEIVSTALIRPMEIMLKDPSIFFVNLYTGFFYGVFYSFFEVFPLVFSPMYGFTLSQTGLTFLSCLVGVSIAISLYFAYLYFYMAPDNKKHGLREQEHRLIPAIVGSVFITIGLFIFAWTSRPDSIFIYLPLSIWRSGIAVGCVAFARPLFVNLGVDRGVKLLGGFSVAGIMGTTAIYVFGKRLRARSKSKFAES